MRLFDIWNVCLASGEKPVSTWASMASLRKPPKVAYRLLKYGAKVGAEFDVIGKQRNKLIYEAAGVPEGGEVKIDPGTPQFSKFVQDFNAFLDNESDLKAVDLSMDALIDALDAEKGNALSESDLALLEPFFHESTKE